MSRANKLNNAPAKSTNTKTHQSRPLTTHLSTVTTASFIARKTPPVTRSCGKAASKTNNSHAQATAIHSNTHTVTTVGKPQTVKTSRNPQTVITPRNPQTITTSYDWEGFSQVDPRAFSHV